MAGFIVAIISGALMSLQGVLNTNVTKASSIWVAAGFVQFTALATCIIMWLFNGRPDISGIFQVENKISLLGGVIGAFITFTVVKSVSDLGVAKSRSHNSSSTGNSSLYNRTYGLIWKQKSRLLVAQTLSPDNSNGRSIYVLQYREELDGEGD